LPLKPVTSISAAEKLTKKQQAPGLLVGDDLSSVCQVYQEFLRLCVLHPRLGHSPVIEKFLMEPEAPARIRIRRNIFDSIKKTVDDKKNLLFLGGDNQLQQTKIQNDENIKSLKQAANSYKKIIDSTYRISAAYFEIQSALINLESISSNSIVKNNDRKWSNKLAFTCEYAADLYKKEAVYCKQSLGCHLDLYEGFARSKQNMHLKRIQKEIDLENSKRNYEKAKPNKKQHAENEMKRLEMELNDMKSLASPEIERFKRQRVFAWQSSLINMTENQVKSSRKALAVFTESCHDLEELRR